jgi:hypothetical protein
MLSEICGGFFKGLRLVYSLRGAWGIWVYFGGRKAIISKLEKNIKSTKKLHKIY